MKEWCNALMIKAEARVRITAASHESLLDLVRLHGLDIVAQTARKVTEAEYSVEGLLSRGQIPELESRGYQIEVLDDLTLRDPKEYVSKTNRFKDELERLRAKRW